MPKCGYGYRVDSAERGDYTGRMRSDAKVRKAFQFLKERALDGQTFTLQELATAADWTIGNTKTNRSKRLSEVVVSSGDGKWRAKPDLLDIPYDRFVRLFTQKNTLFGAPYQKYVHEDVIAYEFFLPLSCEDILRRALDRLFYQDTIVARLRQIGLSQVETIFGRLEGESDDQYLKRISVLAGETFIGYSVSHVSGRFRADALMSRKDAAELEETGTSYLVDETTAVVRFILPLQATVITSETGALPLEDSTDLESEMKQTEWFFHNLFVHAVTQATTDQDQIWLLESGRRNRLFRFVAPEHS